MLPCGTYNTQYRKDIAIVRTRLQWGLLIALFIFLFTVPPLLFSNHWMSFTVNVCISIIAVLGLNILTGLCGQISLGQAAFMGLGAYTTCILVNELGWNFFATIPVAALMAGVVGLLFGVPSLRVKGFYLAITTIAAQFIIMWVIGHPLRAWSGGREGLSLASNPALGNMVFNTTRSFYFPVMGITILMTFFQKNIMRTRMGRAFVAVRDNDLAAEVMGIDVFRSKLLAFFICSAFAGVAGSLFVGYLARIDCEAFTIMDSIWYLGMLIVGGLGSTVGAITGTLFLLALKELAMMGTPMMMSLTAGGFEPGFFAGLTNLVFGIIILVFIIFEPRGINHRWETFKTSYRLHPFDY